MKNYKATFTISGLADDADALVEKITEYIHDHPDGFLIQDVTGSQEEPDITK